MSVVPASESEKRIAQYEHEITELRTQLRFLEEEARLLKRRQPESPRHTKLVEDKLAETRAQLAHA
ncbi:MAG: proteasome ATPase, partial [Actinomycetota bacterium]